MPPVDSLLTLLVEELGQLYDAEQRLMKALPVLADASSSARLIRHIEEDGLETETHISRLDQAFAALDEEIDRRACEVMKALISDGESRATDEYEKGKLRDAAIVAAARQIQHYEIAAYSSAICHAWALREDEVAKLLSATLQEEKIGDRRLKRIAARLLVITSRNQRAVIDRARTMIGSAT